MEKSRVQLPVWHLLRFFLSYNFKALTLKPHTVLQIYMQQVQLPQYLLLPTVMRSKVRSTGYIHIPPSAKCQCHGAVCGAAVALNLDPGTVSDVNDVVMCSRAALKSGAK